jgi:hypothetical protein
LKFYNPNIFLKGLGLQLEGLGLQLEGLGLQLQTVSRMRICYILMSFYKSKRGGLQGTGCLRREGCEGNQGVVTRGQERMLDSCRVIVKLIFGGGYCFMFPYVT